METFERRLAERRTVRLRGYDYSSAGAHPVTVCVHDRRLYFDEVIDGESGLSMEGRMVREE